MHSTVHCHTFHSLLFAHCTFTLTDTPRCLNFGSPLIPVMEQSCGGSIVASEFVRVSGIPSRGTIADITKRCNQAGITLCADGVRAASIKDTKKKGWTAVLKCTTHNDAGILLNTPLCVCSQHCRLQATTVCIVVSCPVAYKLGDTHFFF